MRESYGSMWLFGLVITFVMLFSAFMILMINLMEVYQCKNEALQIIEKYDGFTVKSMPIINNYLKNTGYSTQGVCPSDYTAVTSIEDTNKTSSGKGYYCIKQTQKKSAGTVKYDLIFFYKFNLPILGDFLTFQIGDQSDVIKYGKKDNYIIKNFS